MALAQVFYPVLACTLQIRLDPTFAAGGTRDLDEILRIPLSGDVKLPGYREYGEFSFEFDYAHLPIDPRIVAGCVVEIFIDVVEASAFAQGMRGNKSGAALTSIITPIRRHSDRSRINQRMVGFMDKWEVKHGADGSTATISGRDIRGFLSDKPIGGNIKHAGDWMLKDLNLNQPIHLVVQDLLKLEQDSVLNLIDVYTIPSEWENDAVPSPNSPDLIPVYRQTLSAIKANREKKKQGAESKDPKAIVPAQPTDIDSVRYWDLISQLCFFVGATPIVQGTSIYIRPTKSLYAKLNSKVNPVDLLHPFASGEMRHGDVGSMRSLRSPLSIRKLVYGRDVEEASFFRNYAGWGRPKYVRVVSYDPDSTRVDPITGRIERTLSVSYPDLESGWLSRKDKDDPLTESEVVTITFNESKDPAVLKAVARGAYESLGRGQIGGTVKTRNMASFGGDNTDPDLLRLYPGDAVSLDIDIRALNQNAPLVGFVVDSWRKPFEEAVADVARSTGDPGLARAIVASMRGAVNALPNLFRVANVKFSWSSDDKSGGISVEFDYQNFIEVDADHEPVTTPTTTSSRIEIAPK